MPSKELEEEGQSIEGRLHDLFMMTQVAAEYRERTSPLPEVSSSAHQSIFEVLYEILIDSKAVGWTMMGFDLTLHHLTLSISAIGFRPGQNEIAFNLSTFNLASHSKMHMSNALTGRFDIIGFVSTCLKP